MLYKVIMGYTIVEINNGIYTLKECHPLGSDKVIIDMKEEKVIGATVNGRNYKAERYLNKYNYLIKGIKEYKSIEPYLFTKEPKEEDFNERFKTLSKAIDEWNKTEGFIVTCYAIENIMEENYTENLRIDYGQLIDDTEEDDYLYDKRIQMLNNIIDNLNIADDFKYILKEDIRDYYYPDIDEYFEEIYNNEAVSCLIDYWVARENHESLELYTDKEIDELYDKWIEARRKIISDKDYNIGMEKLYNEIN